MLSNTPAQRANTPVRTSTTPATTTPAACQELKIRARLLLKALQTQDASALARSHLASKKLAWPTPEKWTLRHAMNIVAFEAGFLHWEHAREYLTGRFAQDIPASRFADPGEFWHLRNGHGFINQWFATYAEARQLRDSRHGLLPYKNQFMLAEADYLAALGLPAGQSQDLVSDYGSTSWQALCMARLQATRQQVPQPQETNSAEISAKYSHQVLATFVEQGRLNKIPQKRKKRMVILHWLVQQLEAGRRYSEKEINAFLLQFHEDCATLRREFIASRLMQREDGVYWRC